MNSRFEEEKRNEEDYKKRERELAENLQRKKEDLRRAGTTS